MAQVSNQSLLLHWHLDTKIKSADSKVLLVPTEVKKEEKTKSKKTSAEKNKLHFLVSGLEKFWEQRGIESFTGKAKETCFLRDAHWEGYHHLLFFGLGQDWLPETLRQSAAQAFKALKKEKLKHWVLPLLDPMLLEPELLRAFVEGISLANYEFQELKSSSSQKPEEVHLTLVLPSLGQKSQVEKVLNEALTLSQATCLARRLGDLPGNHLTPKALGDWAQKELGSLSHTKVQIWDKKRIVKEKLGGLLAVNQGSEEEPRLIWIEYKHPQAKNKSPWVFVGKGLTFDSGGISLKPGAGMEEMKFDMCGAAAVLGATWAIAKQKLPLHVVTIVPATENLPSGKALKPGDVYRARNGKTVEVNNTDAEGRLILSEALTLACELEPEQIIDAATLTGAMVVALGNIHTGYFTNSDVLKSQIEQAANQSGEKVWHMPLTEEHEEDMKGVFADLSNISSGKGAGSATAAAFLKQFIKGDIPWAHFDIAGTAWSVGNRLSYCPAKGASGVMVRSFYTLAKMRSARSN